MADRGTSRSPGEALASSGRGEGWFRELLRYAADVITVLSADATVLYDSPAIERVFGYAPGERVGEKNLDYVHPGDVKRIGEAFAELLKGPGVDVPLGYRMRHEDGSWRHVESSWVNLLDDPAVGGVVVNTRDVTERKEAEEALKEERNLLRTVIDTVPGLVFAKDTEHRFVVNNEEHLQVLGAEGQEETLGSTDEEFMPEDLTEGYHADDRRVFRTGRPQIGKEEPVVVPSGERRWISTSKVPLRNDEGEIEGLVAVSQDVTERRRASEALRESEQRLRSLVEQAADAIFVHDLEGRFLDVNWQSCESLGYTREELLALSVEDVEQDIEAPAGFERLWERVASEGSVTFEGIHRRKDGTTFPVEVRVGPLEAGGRQLMLAVARDVTKRKEAEEALRESEERFKSLVQNASDMISILNPDGTIRYVSPSVERILGYRPEERVGADAFGAGIHPDDIESMRDAFAEGLKHPGGVSIALKYRLRHRDGSWRHLEAVATNQIDHPAIGGIVVNARDVTERRAYEERLEYQALHDELTGLPNRTLFADRLSRVLTCKGGRGGENGGEGEQVAVLFLDLDNFKYVNDSLGHDAGDRLLATAAKRLKGCVRPGDTVARLGGDEFAVLLEGAGDLGDATRVAQRAVEALKEPFDLGGREVITGTSVGIALGSAGDQQDRPEDLLKQADLALYEAKREGKARYAVYDPEAERRSLRRLELENGLRRALERDEFRVYYQPVASLKTGRIAGFEALLRWEHPERGLIPPGEFVPLAEENGMIIPIGERVLREACRRAREWQELRPGSPPTVGVNLSASQLSHPDLVGEVESVLNETGLDPGRLTLEVTESVLVEDEGRHADTLRELRKLGVRFAIDDFGTGYSSLSYLRRLPTGLLKLDGSFVAGIGEGAEEDEVLLSGVIGLAHGLGLEVVAEGVETAEQAARLRKLGCDLAQGNYFSEPLPGEEAALGAEYYPNGFTR